jgi:hypothetical protein
VQRAWRGVHGRGRSYRRKALIYCAQTAATAVNTYNLSCEDIQHLAAVVCEVVKQQGLMTDYDSNYSNTSTATTDDADGATITDTAKHPPAVVLALLQLVSFT